MNEFSSSPNPVADPSFTALQEEVRSLRMMVMCLLALLILMSFCYDIYLLRQVSMLRSEVSIREQQVNDFQKKTLPAVAEFWQKLQQYSVSHPDYKPILDKYSSVFVFTPGMATPAKK